MSWSASREGHGDLGLDLPLSSHTAGFLLRFLGSKRVPRAEVQVVEERVAFCEVCAALGTAFQFYCLGSKTTSCPKMSRGP